MRRLVVPIAVGIVGMVIAPVVGPTLGRLLRPVAKGGIKAGISIYQRGRVLGTELAETTEDLIAEANAELGGDTES